MGLCRLGFAGFQVWGSKVDLRILVEFGLGVYGALRVQGPEPFGLDFGSSGSLSHSLSSCKEGEGLHVFGIWSFDFP